MEKGGTMAFKTTLMGQNSKSILIQTNKKVHIQLHAANDPNKKIQTQRGTLRSGY